MLYSGEDPETLKWRLVINNDVCEIELVLKWLVNAWVANEGTVYFALKLNK